MKPNFALSLSSEAIGLLHRTSRGWLPVGEVATDSPDLAAQLSWLRSTAQELSPQGITTKLILPSDQILFTEVLAPGPDSSQRRRQIRRALEGRTPYKLDELVFDWWGTGDRVQVAVVAKETLEEAEAFATEHRFNPVSFVAIPPTPAFAGEPFFGQTKDAARIVGAGETVGRDQDPVKIIARDTVPPEAVPRPVAEAPAIAPAQVPAPPPVATVAAPEKPEPVQEVPAPEPVPAEAAAALLEPAPIAPEPEPVAPEPPPTAVVEPVSSAPAIEEPPARPVDAPSPKAEAEIPTEPAADFAARPVAPETGPPTALVAAVAAIRSRSGAGKSAEADLPTPSPSPEEPPATPTFSSRRRDETAGLSRTGTVPLPPTPPVTAPKPAPESNVAARAPAAAPPPRPVGPKVSAPVIPLAGAAARSAAPSPAGKATASRPAALVSAKPADRRMPDATGAPQGAAGALGARTARQRGKPRYLGLVLTGALLLFLFLVAAWSSLYLARDDSAPPQDGTAVAQSGSEGATAPATDGAPGEIDPEFAADLAAMGEPVDELPAATEEQAAAEDVPLPAVTETATATLSASDAEPAAPEPVAEATPEPEPEPAPETGAESETAAIQAPGFAGQDEIFLARADEAPMAVDPLVLPPPAAADTPPTAQMPPPPAGTTYAFDADGRIVAPPGGIITPEGVWLIAARPPVLPPARPATAPEADLPTPETALVAGAAEPEAATPAPEVPAIVDTGFVPAPDSATLRPRARPAIPEPQQAEDDAGLLPDTDTRLATLRPQERPATLAAAATPTDASQASIFAASAVSPDPADPLAVVYSRRPAPRPQDFTAAVEAAVAAAVRPEEPVAPEANEPANPDLSPEEMAEDSGTEEPSAAPRIPTSANVAREATFANAINLSKINLIGIYGTASNRSALVRLASGRYVKVEVGDRVDGGKVAAITTSELRYQKGGRLVTLTMPRG